MIQQAYITAWRAVAPWPDDAQVEQDLAISRAVVQIFQRAELGTRKAPRFTRPVRAEPSRQADRCGIHGGHRTASERLHEV